MFLAFIQKSRTIQLCCGITFIVSGILINLIQFFLYVTVKPINKWLFSRINWYLNAMIYAELVFMAQWWAGMELNLVVDKDVYENYLGKEHAYCIMNHTYEIDWLIGWVLANTIKLLGNCKAYIKKELQFLPVIGWSWKMSDFILLERSFEKDKDNIGKQITKLVNHADYVWILMFPEGTRFTKAKHEASEIFAEKKHLTPLKYHLQPRTRGFIASLPAMQGKVPAIYDILIAFKEDDPVQPTISNLISAKAGQAYLYLHRMPMEDVPATEVDQDKFLHDLFIRKDRLKESFIKTGDFFTLSGEKRVPTFKPKRRIEILINFIMWSIIIWSPLIYYILGLFYSGSYVALGIVLGILVICVHVMKKLVSSSEINKSSSYGTATVKKNE